MATPSAHSLATPPLLDVDVDGLPLNVSRTSSQSQARSGHNPVRLIDVRDAVAVAHIALAVEPLADMPTRPACLIRLFHLELCAHLVRTSLGWSTGAWSSGLGLAASPAVLDLDTGLHDRCTSTAARCPSFFAVTRHGPQTLQRPLLHTFTGATSTSTGTPTTTATFTSTSTSQLTATQLQAD